ncbi:MAG: integrase [Holophagaceae bacterium]|nr:integrase [Holophagaceae bacterium]
MTIATTIKMDYELPETASSRDGIEWNPRDQIWRFSGLSKNHLFNFDHLSSISTENIITSLKFLLTYYICNYSMNHSDNGFGRICALISHAHRINNKKIDTISLEMAVAYRVTLDRRKEWYLGSMRGFLKKWIDLRLPGLDPKVVVWLDEIHLKGNIKGEAVTTLDPATGAFSTIEYQGIITALNNQFAKGAIELEDYILVWLFMALGTRAINLAALKIKDFGKVNTSDGITSYLIQVPRAKQRGKLPRSEFKARKLISELGILLDNYAQSVRMKWGHLMANSDELPLFVKSNDSVAFEGLKHHYNSNDIAIRLRSIFDILGVKSERTNGPLHITTKRFRYTIGTRAAAEGASELVIAELLDHSDTQNVGVYLETVPEILDRIDKAMAIHLAPMAQAFAGQLINDESQAKRGGDPRSRIVGPEAPKRPVGNCGSFGFCGAAAPIACYTCRNFQPWRDGPHAEVLKSLIAERERVLAETGDARIAYVNDRTILACAEVVRMCSGLATSPMEE